MTSIGFPKPRPRIEDKRERLLQKRAAEKAFLDAVWKRDGSYCHYCWRRVVRGTPDMFLRGEVHHIEPRSRAKGKRFDPKNGVVLCVLCHVKAQRHEITVSR